MTFFFLKKKKISALPIPPFPFAFVSILNFWFYAIFFVFLVSHCKGTPGKPYDASIECLCCVQKSMQRRYLTSLFHSHLCICDYSSPLFLVSIDSGRIFFHFVLSDSHSSFFFPIPYHDSDKTFLSLTLLDCRRELAMEALRELHDSENCFLISLSAYPLLGVNRFLTPHYEPPRGQGDISQSDFCPDEMIFPHERFRSV